MKIRNLFIASLVIVSFSVNAQKQGPLLVFEKTTHDFGTIKEEDGTVTYDFKFTNTGNAPLVIQAVRPSCGCTTTGWTRDPVLPNQEGFVQATYNPKNRPGAFNKSLTITSNSNPGVARIFIKGAVTPKPKTPADEYPTVMGGIRVKYRSFNFGKITTEKPLTRNFDVYNDSDEPITFTDEMQVPAHIKIEVKPKTIAPKTIGAIQITYDPIKKNDLGFLNDRVVLNTDEKENSMKDFRVVASVEEYFPPMTPEELANAPRLSFENIVHDFGTIKQGDVVSTDFIYTNTGKQELNIRKTKANCGCTATQPQKMTLQPGESSSIKVTFDSRGRRGIQQKSVTIFSNDPAHPTQRITIKAKIDVDS